MYWGQGSPAPSSGRPAMYLAQTWLARCGGGSTARFHAMFHSPKSSQTPLLQGLGLCIMACNLAIDPPRHLANHACARYMAVLPVLGAGDPCQYQVPNQGGLSRG